MVASFKALVKIGVDKVFLHFRSMELVVIHQGLDSGGHTVDRLVRVLQHVQVAVDLIPPIQTEDETRVVASSSIRPFSISVSSVDSIRRWTKFVDSGRVQFCESI